MKSFILSLFPNHIPKNIDPSDSLLILRERVLHIILLSVAGLGSLFFLVTVTQSLKRSPIFISMVGFTVIFMLSLILFRQWSFIIRSWLTIIVLYALTIVALAIYGVDGSGMLLALSVSVIVFLMRGPSVGFILTVINILTVILVGWLMVTGSINPPAVEYQYDSTMLGGWINTGLAYFVLTMCVMTTLVTMVLGLQQATQKQSQLSKELIEERNTLEARVSQRTFEVEHRATQIEIAISIAREILQETNLDKLLNNSVELIRERFALYYVAIFLVDEQNEFVVLKSGTGEAGREMLERSHKLKIGQVGMVGYVVANNEFRLAQDVKSDPAHYENPFLPATQSELALPLNLEGKVIGAIDVQSTQKDFFSPEDIKALQLTADQIAVAIQRARLVAQLEQSVSSLEKGQRQFTQQSWRTHLRSSRQNYSYRLSQSSFEEDFLPSPESRVVLEKGRPSISNNPVTNVTNKPVSTIAIPIRLRNQVLGVIDVRFDSQKTPPDMLPLLEAAADRLALALENARLLEEVKSRAESDRLVSEVSNRVRSATNVDNVLKTAVSELGRSLGINEVVVHLITSE